MRERTETRNGKMQRNCVIGGIRFRTLLSAKLEAYAAVFFDPHFGQTLPANPLNPQSKQRLAVNITFLYAVSPLSSLIVPVLLSQHHFPTDKGECQKNPVVSA
jgi:hypothetical protein